MKLCFHSQLQSIPLIEIHFSWVTLVCPLGRPAVISSCCQSGAAITDLGVCWDLKGFQSPIDGARQLKWKKKITSTVLLLLQEESEGKHGSLDGLAFPGQTKQSFSLKKSTDLEFSTVDIHQVFPAPSRHPDLQPQTVRGACWQGQPCRTVTRGIWKTPQSQLSLQSCSLPMNIDMFPARAQSWH